MKTNIISSTEVKRDILWRVYVCFIAIVMICVFILYKAFVIQQIQGKHWRSMSDSLYQKIQEVDADRGTIYSDDGHMLSGSIPQFDIYIDLQADGLTENGGKLFKENVDSLSYCLAGLFKDRTSGEYKKALEDGYASQDRYFLLRKKVGFEEYKTMKQFPLVRLGRNKSGFIAETKNIRLNPYQLLAFRTIGLDRDNFQKVGLEQTYDTALKGTNGKRLVRYIAGGVAVPINDSNFSIDPENGKDIFTTLDMHIQDITENALMKMMVGNQAQHGCAIVMEVKTGKIKAIANLGVERDGSYWENFNYALMPTEPGSTFKLVTLLSALRDNKVSLTDMVNLQGGVWQINGRTVYDVEKNGLTDVTVKRAFEMSSNVGLGKIAYHAYASYPSQFINHIHKLGLNITTGVDLAGERQPIVLAPGNSLWSATTLPWMGFGYNIEITPLHTAMVYNAVANGGKMMKPYLVESEKEDGEIIKQINPIVLHDSICRTSTLKQLQECLYGVCNDSSGTGFKLFKGSKYHVAGKTGTALVAEKGFGYANHIYQSSFAGFFPAEDPQYTCVVVIVNKAGAVKFYGAEVAGPVFKEIADQVYNLYVQQDKHETVYSTIAKNDSNAYSYKGMGKDMKQLLHQLGVAYTDSTTGDGWMKLYKGHATTVAGNLHVSPNQMPQLTGMGLKDAIYLCENMGLKVNVKGIGRVAAQSIAAGEAIAKGQLVNLELN